jgi:hypothetical protein
MRKIVWTERVASSSIGPHVRMRRGRIDEAQVALMRIDAAEMLLDV